MDIGKQERTIKVAILGGGPCGFGAALELAKLPFVNWNLYEKKAKISETGGALSLQPNTWKLLEHNGTAGNIDPQDYFRPADNLFEQRRNGRNGTVLLRKRSPSDVPANRQACRLVRAKLQTALLKNADKSRVHVSKKLVAVKQLPDNLIRLFFEDESLDDVNLLIGADGVRSFVRTVGFPGESTLQYNGQTVYRTIVSKADVSRIEGIPQGPVWWKDKSGLYVFTCPLGNDDFEVTARIIVPQEEQPPSWGRPFDFHALLHEYKDFCAPVKQILRLAAKAQTQEFALFSATRLQSMVSRNNIVLLGDAAHPLFGNFGAGCQFALEDVYALAKVLEWAVPKGVQLKVALDLFNSIRTPHYRHLYSIIDKCDRIKDELKTEDFSIDKDIAERIKRISDNSEDWMYYYDISSVVEEAISRSEMTLTMR